MMQINLHIRKGLAIGIILLFVGVTIAPSVNFTAVNASNNKQENEISQKDLLFQTILDVANNREIQKIVFSSEMQGGVFFNTGMRFSVFIPQVITKNYLNSAYRIGLILSKTVGVTRMHSILERYQLHNQGMQKEISAVIEKDVTLNNEIKQLSNSKCDCEDISGVTVWHFPVICTILAIILFFLTFIVLYLHVGTNIFRIIGSLFEMFNCPGTP